MLLFVDETPDFSNDHDHAWHCLKQLYEKNINATFPTILRKKNGKPYFKDSPYFFNLSHSDGKIVVAIDLSPIGVDIQKIVSPSSRLMERVCSFSEIEWLNKLATISPRGHPNQISFGFSFLWCGKEAIVKQSGLGVGSGRSLKNLCTLPTNPPELCQIPLTLRNQIVGEENLFLSRWIFHDFSLGFATKNPFHRTLDGILEIDTMQTDIIF